MDLLSNSNSILDDPLNIPFKVDVPSQDEQKTDIFNDVVQTTTRFVLQPIQTPVYLM